jgi:hypothetical protein
MLENLSDTLAPNLPISSFNKRDIGTIAVKAGKYIEKQYQ